MKRYMLIFLVCGLMLGCEAASEENGDEACNPDTYVKVCLDASHSSMCLNEQVVPVACPDGQSCVNGTCGSTAAVPCNGESAVCDGNTVVKCVNGVEQRELCSSGCFNGACVTSAVCVPRCLDATTLVTCDGGVEGRKNCENGCENAACLDAQVCEPRCDGSTLIYCVNGEETSKVCDKGCENAACVDMAVCGNQRIEAGELCDGKDIGEANCYDVPGTDERASYDGKPECNATCDGLLMGSCEMTQCGNGKLQQDHGELCEFDASGNSIFWPGSEPKCEDLMPGMNFEWLEGMPACSRDCKSLAYGTCVMAPQPLFGIDSCYFKSLEKDENTKSMIGIARIKPRQDATADLLSGRLACGSLERPTYEWKQYAARFTECADCESGEYEMISDFSYEFISAGTHNCVFQVDLDESDLPDGSLSTEYVNCPIVYGNPHPQKAVSDAVIRQYEVEAAQIDGVVLAHWDFSNYVKDDTAYIIGADNGEYKANSVLKLSDESEIRMLSKSDTMDAAASGKSWSMASTMDLYTTKHFVFKTKTSGYENIRFQFNVAGSGVHEKRIATAIQVLGVTISVGTELKFDDKNTFHAYPLTVIPDGNADDASELELRIYTWGAPDVNATVRIDDIYIIGDKKAEGVN